MKPWFQKLWDGDIPFSILNTLFWLALGYFLLSDPARLFVGGGLIAILLGIGLLYAAFSAREKTELAHQQVADGLQIGLGALSLGIGMFLVLGFLVASHTPTRHDLVQQSLEMTASGNTSLYLSRFSLQEIPPEVWEMEHITELKLSDNQLRSLPPEIGRLQQLETLRLENNRLQSLPPELAQLQNLKFLDLRHNRFTTFPDVLLELPNLETLYLANRMGELPAALAQRAEAGELIISYQLPASSINWTWLTMILLVVVFPTTGAVLLNRWWTKWEHAQQQAAQNRGRVFTIPPLARGTMLWLFLTTLGVSLFLYATLRQTPPDPPDPSVLIFSLVAFAVWVFIPPAWLWHNSGFVVAQAYTISLWRLGSEKTLPYADIHTLAQRFAIPPVLRLRGRKGVLSIPLSVEKQLQLEGLILERISPEARNKALGATPTPSGNTYRFSISRRVWALYITGTVLVTLLYLGFGLLGLWMPWLQGLAPPFTSSMLTGAAIMFGMISIFFLPALIIVVHGLLTPYGPYKTKQPSALELTPRELRYHFPRGPWYTRSASAVQRIWLELAPVNTQVDGVSITMPHHLLFIEFSDGERLVINQERARQFGTSPEQLYVVFNTLYA